MSMDTDHNSLMKRVASGGLLPEVNFLTGGSASKETTVGGEGHLRRLNAQKVQEKLGIPSIPHQDRVGKGKRQPGERGKEQMFFGIFDVVWDG